MRSLEALLLAGLLLGAGCSSIHRQPEMDHGGALVAAARGMARVVDLTQTLDGEATVYSPELGWRFEVQPHEDSVVPLIKTGEHTGTHMDSALHFLVAGADMADSRPGDLLRPAVVLDLREETRENPNLPVDVARLERWEREHGKIPVGSIVVLLTGREESGFASSHDHPGFTLEAATFLRTERDIAGVGTDALSPDIGNSLAYPVHQRLLQDECMIVENLRHLGRLPPIGAHLVMGPLPVDDATGAPARVLGLLGEDDAVVYRFMDLTHVLGRGTPYLEGRDPLFPRPERSGTALAPVRRSGSFQPARLLYYGGVFSVGQQTGTHLTFPALSVQGEVDAARFPAGDLLAPLVVLDLTDLDPGTALDPVELRRRLGGATERGAVVLLRTRRWYSVGGGRRTRGYPGLSPDAAETLMSAGARGVISQAAAIDPSGVDGRPAERVVHQHGGFGGGFMNLPRRRTLPGSGASIALLSLPIAGAGAAPARVVAVFPEP